MVESKKDSTPAVTLPKTETKTFDTKVSADLSTPAAALLASGKLQEAEKEANEAATAAARARRVSERMGEEEKKEAEAKKAYVEGLVKKKYDVTPATIHAPSHEGPAPEQIVVTNKVVASDKEVEESKKNAEVMWASSPFNPKNIKTLVASK